MRVEQDFKELLELFNKYRVKYCIIGAFAFAFYARPRYTKDMDILVEPSLENGERIITALKRFGFGSLNLSAKDFSKEGKVIQLGYEPVRVDILTSITGFKFGRIWKNRRTGSYGDVKLHFISLDDLIKSKKKTGRKQDRADLELLLSAKKRTRR